MDERRVKQFPIRFPERRKKMAPPEYETLLNTMQEGFSGVHSRIDSFKDEFSAHRLVCRDLFAQINRSEACRQGAENEAARQLKKRIDWAKVKTGVTIAVGGVIAIAAVKILLLNFDKLAK